MDLTLGVRNAGVPIIRNIARKIRIVLQKRTGTTIWRIKIGCLNTWVTIKKQIDTRIIEKNILERKRIRSIADSIICSRNMIKSVIIIFNKRNNHSQQGGYFSS